MFHRTWGMGGIVGAPCGGMAASTAPGGKSVVRLVVLAFVAETLALPNKPV